MQAAATHFYLPKFRIDNHRSGQRHQINVQRASCQNLICAVVFPFFDFLATHLYKVDSVVPDLDKITAQIGYSIELNYSLGQVLSQVS